jgi:ABC-2 type transport system permease protein
VYQYRLVADRLQENAWLYRLNPITPIVLTFQRAVYNKVEPTAGDGTAIAILPGGASVWWYLAQLGVVIAAAAALLLVALSVFGRLEGNFAEEL